MLNLYLKLKTQARNAFMGKRNASSTHSLTARQNEILLSLVGVAAELAKHDADQHTLNFAFRDLQALELVESMGITDPASALEVMSSGLHDILDEWIHPEHHALAAQTFRETLLQVLCEDFKPD